MEEEAYQDIRTGSNVIPPTFLLPFPPMYEIGEGGKVGRERGVMREGREVEIMSNAERECEFPSHCCRVGFQVIPFWTISDR